MKLSKEDIIALIASILIHILLFLYLYFGVFKRIIPATDDGIFVNFGDLVEATGEFEPQASVSSQQIAQVIPRPQPKPTANEEMITQDEEETVHIPNTKKKKNNLAENKPRKTVKQPTAEERLKEEQRKKQQEEEQQAGNIRNKVSNAFNRTNTQGSTQGNAQSGSSEVSGFSDNSVNNSQSQGSGASGRGNQGSPFGNSDAGPSQGVGGSGSFSLSGRTLRDGVLPRPDYTAQVEGRIVINITVDSNGNVIFAEIGKGTNIDDASMRRSAIAVARKARFNKIQESNNQNGTITYIYRLM